MYDDVLTALERFFAVLTDDTAPTRVSIGFAPEYRQHPSISDWLADHDLYAAIDATRRAVQAGRIDESESARAERERVRAMDDVQAFVAERAEARQAYDMCCAALGEQLPGIAGLPPPQRLAALVDCVMEAKALDERLHAYIVNYNRAGTMVARRLEWLAGRGMPVQQLTVPTPLPSYALIEAMYCLTVASLLRGTGDTGTAGYRARLSELAGATDRIGGIVRRGLWVFARGSVPTLERKLRRSGWLDRDPQQLFQQATRLLQRHQSVSPPPPTEFDSAIQERLADLRTLLFFDHVEDALRSTVYNGLEDYVARCLLTEQLHELGVVDTSEPMDYSQDWLLTRAAEYRRRDRAGRAPAQPAADHPDGGQPSTGQTGDGSAPVTGRAGEPPVVWLGNDTLSRPALVQVARQPGRVELRVAPEAEQRMRRSVSLRDELIATRTPIYGVTTGFGASNIRQIPPEKTVELQRNVIRYHLVGTGDQAPPEVVRATMLLRANCLARGHSAVRPEVVELLRDCLAADLLPRIPERGSVGASGDLVPLCYLASLLVGEGEVLVDGAVRPAAEALRAHGLQPLRLQPKESLALINGTSFMTAYAALAANDAAEIAAAADLCTALSSEVLRGNRDHFAPFSHQQRPHPGQLRSAGRIRHLLTGSQLARSQAEIVEANPHLTGDRTYLELTDPIQDRYSVRCAPHVVGVLYDTLEWVDRWLSVEMNSTNDNPLFDSESGLVFNGGNFYGGHVGHAMDSLKLAIAQVGDLLDRQLALVVDEKFNNGLTPNLVPPFTAGDWEAALHHGMKGLQIACSSLAAEALKLTAPATVFSRPTESYNQDKVSMGTIAARDARTIAGLVTEIVAMHLVALCQAADLRGKEKLAPRTRAAYELIRERVPFVDADRRLDADVASVVALIRSGELRAVADADSGSPDRPAEDATHSLTLRR
ncbi:MAG TPA: aromatic amino acid ammonia-lyase [Natronosporangium sp.]